MRAFLPLVASVSAIALVVAIYAVQSSSGDPPLVRQLQGDVDDLRRHTSALGETIRELADEIASLNDSIQALQRAPRERAADDESGRLEKLTAKLEEMAGSLKEIDARSRRMSVLIGAVRTVETPEERTAVVEENQSVALDRSLTPQSRLQALRSLRGRNGRSHEVTLAMIELIQDPNVDSSTRADIIRNLHGVTFEELKQPLLNRLEDPDPETRSETVETLDVFYDDQTVYDAVLHVRDNDKDLRVRMEATQRLQRFQQQTGGRDR